MSWLRYLFGMPGNSMMIYIRLNGVYFSSQMAFFEKSDISATYLGLYG